MSVDKETVLPSERPGVASLPPPPQQHPQLFNKCTENPQQPLKTKDDEFHNLGERETGDHVHNRAISPGQAMLKSSIQSHNGIQQAKPQPRLNKRRSTMSSGFKQPIFGKRRRRANSESESVLPTNFLLGGNIFDPLNLNSLLDEEVNRALNAETPKSSPLPAKSRDPVEILIPRDITDPLNLNCCATGDGGLLLTPLKSGGGGRRRHRNRHHGGATGVGGTGRGTEGTMAQLDLSESEKSRSCSASQTELQVASSELHSGCLAFEAPGEEASESNSIPAQEAQSPSCPSSTAGQEKDEKPPVLENPAPSMTTAPTVHRQRKRKRTSSKSENSGAPILEKNKTQRSSCSFQKQPQPDHIQEPGLQAQQQHPNNRRHQKNHQKQNQQHQKKNQQQQHKKKFQYGNYNQYYGYRNPGSTEDPRLHTLRPEWFQGKEVLDLGCNTGRLTLAIAKNWQPSRIVGLDIDGALIHAARQNIRYYLSEMHVLKARATREDERSVTIEKGEEGKERERDGEHVEKMDGELAEGERNDSEMSIQSTDRSGVPLKEEREEHGVYMDEEMEKLKVVEEVQEAGEEKYEMTMEDKSGEEVSEAAEQEVALNRSPKKDVFSASDENHVFPVSLRISRGPIAAPPLPETHTTALPLGDFPANVTFVKVSGELCVTIHLSQKA